MSIDYAAGLSHYDDLGVCNIDEVFDTKDVVEQKVSQLAELLRQSQFTTAHVGAGLSTSAGIADFRGKGGVWSRMTEEKKSVSKSSRVKTSSSSPSSDDTTKTKLEQAMTSKAKPFDETIPTVGHYALKALCEVGLISHIVSQNVDGLFLKTNLKRKFISELHGNFLLDECTKCRSRFIRSFASKTMCLQKSDIRCLRNNNFLIKQQDNETIDKSKLVCTGYLRDTILDWESPVPYQELRVAEKMSKKTKLHLVIGTTLQLLPSRNFVCKRSIKDTKLVVINLQPTHLDDKADLVINYYSDDVLLQLIKILDLKLESYNPENDPTKTRAGTMWLKSS